MDDAVNVVSLARDREILYRNEAVQSLSAEVAWLSTELAMRALENADLRQRLGQGPSSSSGPRLDPAEVNIRRILDARRTTLRSWTVLLPFQIVTQISGERDIRLPDGHPFLSSWSLVSSDAR